MKRTIYDYNSLLRVYMKYCRKLSNLRHANRNVRRQSILEKHIERLLEKLKVLNATLKLTVASSSLVVGAMIFTPQLANAQSFAAKQVNPFGLTNSYYNSAPTFADIDGDGDLDMLSGSNEYSYNYDYATYTFEYEYYFKYYENTGTAANPVFAAAQINPFGIEAPDDYSERRMSPRFVDIDNDGDFDIMYGVNNGNFNFLENTGTPTAPSFGPKQINPFGLIGIGYYGSRSAPSFADLDNDGDLDLVAGNNSSNLFYFENIGTASAPAFGPMQINPFGIYAGYYGYASGLTPSLVDIDVDGDYDILAGDSGGEFQFFENTGTASVPNFANPVLNPFGLTSVGLYNYVGRAKPAFGDIDNDGDLDLLAGDSYGDFSYYKQCVASSSTISPSAACGYISPSGNFYTSGGTYFDVIPNASGCDSLITINLTIGPLIDQSVMATNSTVCANGSTTITLGGSQDGATYYLRDDATDVLIDGPITGNGSSIMFNTGSIINTTTYNVYSEGQGFSTGLSFDGNDDRVNIPGIDVSNSSFSIEFWAKRESVNSQDHIIGQGTDIGNQGLHIGFRGNNRFTFAFFGDDLDTPNSYTDSDWHHYAVTYDVSTGARIIYRDGNIEASDIAGGMYTGTGNIIIGDTPWGNDEYEGAVDELRVWNSVRTQTEIQDNMNECLTGSETDLEAYFQFEDGTGSSTLTDLTSNAHHGTLQNMDVNADWGISIPSCDACDLEMTQTVTVTVTPNPDASVTLTNETITADLAGADYQWVDCDNGNSPINGEESQSFTATSNGNYAVEVTVNGCTSTSNCVSISTVSVDEMDANNAIQVYPNPTEGSVNVVVPESMLGESIVLTNSIGQEVGKQNVNSTSVEFNMESLTNGIYFIQVQTAEGLISKKIIKK